MPTLGVAMIVQNEQIHIPATVAQFYHAADDIVVVDGGSTDNTVEWALRMGVRLIHRPFRNDFSDQKNYAISALKTDWVYVHDADERIEPTLASALPYLISEEGQQVLMERDIIASRHEPYDCFGFARKTFVDGVQIAVYPDYQYRLFRPGCKYVGPVHEIITGFKARTEVDYKRSGTPASRYNILHYKSSAIQRKQEELYERIKGEHRTYA